MAFSRLSGDVVAQIISFTTPQDACTMSSVSTNFTSIADSDQVWANILPPGCENLIPQTLLKKSLYRQLCDHPVPIDSQNVSLSLDKKSGKKCFMLGARDLTIAWGDNRNYWKGIATRESSSAPIHVVVLHQRKNQDLGTNYAAYFVFQFEGHKDRFDKPVKSHVCIDSDNLDEGQSVTLDPKEGEPSAIRERANRWMEIKMGEFYNENGDDGTLVCILREVVRCKSGLIFEGIELRPTGML